jgi:hypothetical protein
MKMHRGKCDELSPTRATLDAIFRAAESALTALSDR